MMKKPALFVLAAVASLAPLASCEGGEIHTAWAIGVDVDQGPQNEHVLTSAMKLLSTAVPNALDGVLGDFNGGVSLTLGAKEDAVGLPDAESSWRFENFRREQYEAIYAQVRDGEITIPSSTTDSGAELTTFLVANGYEQAEAEAIAEATVPATETSAAYRAVAPVARAEAPAPLTVENVQIAMMTDTGTIDDKSFNQGTWEAIQLWAQKNNLSESQYSYSKPASATTADYQQAISDAIADGANVIVCPGYLFTDAFQNLVPQNPDVYFIGVDFTQNNIADCPNAINLNFKEQEAGFFAGYAAAMEGLKSVGFMGGQAIPAPVRYGIGFVAGVAYANHVEGTECSITADHIWYCGTFNSTPNTIVPRIQGWYNEGVEAVFAAAGQAGNDVFTACDNYTRG